MIEIIHTENIAAPQPVVWGVIMDTSEYPEWNRFVVECQSSFEIGEPIKMWVRVLPCFAMPQKETILAHSPGEYLEYGIKLPLGMLRSERSQALKEIDGTRCQYISRFKLQGWLAPVVKLLLHSQLKRGFNEMTAGVVKQSQSLV